MQESIPMLVLDLTSECKYNQNVHFVHPGEIVMAFNLIWYTHCDPCSNHLWTFGLQLPKNSNHLVRPTFLSVLPPSTTSSGLHFCLYYLLSTTMWGLHFRLYYLIFTTLSGLHFRLYYLLSTTLSDLHFCLYYLLSTTLSGLHFCLYYLLSTSLARNMWHTLNYNQWF